MIICLYTNNKSNDEDTTLAELAVGSVVIVAPATGFPPLKKYGMTSSVFSALLTMSLDGSACDAARSSSLSSHKRRLKYS
jgi:hypothetical protein